MVDTTEPRSWWGTFWMFFGVMAVPFAILMALFTGMPLSWTIFEGIFFGLLMGLFLASKFKGETIKLKITNKKEFLNKINTKLSQIGYHLESTTDNFFTYKPSFQTGLLAGRITIAITQKEAVIVGASVYVKKLQNLS